MVTEPASSPRPPYGSTEPVSPPEGRKTEENIEAVLDFYSRESRKISVSQRVIERISQVTGQPGFLAMTLISVALWIGTNSLLTNLGRPALDPFPYHLLHGIISLGALLTATVLLIRQERLSRLAEKREHLDLRVTLMTEQKVAKLIELIEELRRDLPNVRNRHDSGAAELKEPVNPDLVLATLAESLSEDARSEIHAEPSGEA